jgi:predicted nucleotidyltransferase
MGIFMFKKLFKYHNTLAPKIWDTDNHVNQLVSQSLQMMAFEYIRYLGTVLGLPISSDDIHDIFIHGSLANYYWDKHSDVDICLVADLTKLREKLPDLNIFLFFNTTQRAWQATFKPTIFGRNVDIFIFDKPNFLREVKTAHDAYYSLLSEKWLIEPQRVPDDQLKLLYRMTYQRYRVIIRQCKYILKHNMEHEFVDAYLSTLKAQRRRSAVDPYGYAITSTQLAFKAVRNTGIFNKMRRNSKKQLSKRYTLK